MDNGTRVIKFRRQQTGSPDGVNVELYRAGNCYGVPYGLARVFVEIGAAIYIDNQAGEREPGPTETADAQPKETAAAETINQDNGGAPGATKKAKAKRRKGG